jgi:hypothetical protein
MTDRQMPWWTGIAWGASGAVLATCAGYWWEVLAWLEDFDKLAGWAQAVGGIASILFSGWFVAQQIRAGRELEIERRKAGADEAKKRALRLAETVALRLDSTYSTLQLFINDKKLNAMHLDLAASEMEGVRRVYNQIDLSLIDVELFKEVAFLEIMASVGPKKYLFYKDSLGEKLDVIGRYLEEDRSRVLAMAAAFRKSAATALSEI